MSMMQEALRLAGLGYRVFPCRLQAKTPLIKKWQTLATNDPGQIETWWKKDPNANLAISTAGLLMLDVDAIDGQQNPWLTSEREHGFAGIPSASTPKGGRHYFFKQPAGKSYRNTQSKLATNIDTRADGGYVIVAPSFVVSDEIPAGKSYTWQEGRGLDCPPDALPEPPDWLLEMLDSTSTSGTTRRSDAPQVAHRIPQGRRNSTLASRAGTMRQYGWSECEILAALRQANADRCEPPLDDGDVITIAKSIARYEPHQARAGVIEGTLSAPVDFPRITCRELDTADYKTEYLIDKTLVAGQPCILAGGKKTLKTSIAVDAGISLASGSPFLGKLAVSRTARVALISGESGLSTLQDTARRVARSKGLELAQIEGLIWSNRVPRFGNISHTDALRRYLTDDQIDVLVVDPAYLAMPTDGKESSLFKMGELLYGMSELCQELGTTLILLHHTKKATGKDPYSPAELDDMAWAGFPEFARQWLLLNRREQFLPGSGLHRLWLNVGGSAGHSDLWGLDVVEGAFEARTWDVTLNTADAVRQQQRQSAQAHKEARDQAKEQDEVARAGRLKETIRVAFASLPGRKGTKRALRESFGNTKAFNRAFDELVDGGQLVPSEIKRSNGQTYDGYALAI